MKKQYRDTLKILYDLLVICSKQDMIISKVTLKSKMNFHECKPFLIKLKKIGYIRSIDTGKKVNNHPVILYCTTKKGFEFVKNIKDWVKFDDSS